MNEFALVAFQSVVEALTVGLLPTVSTDFLYAFQSFLYLFGDTALLKIMAIEDLLSRRFDSNSIASAIGTTQKSAVANLQS